MSYVILTQYEIKAYSDWCQEHLTVDFKDEDGWATMYFGGQRIIRCWSEDGVPQDYLLCATPMADKVYNLYLEWRNYK